MIVRLSLEYPYFFSEKENPPLFSVSVAPEVVCTLALPGEFPNLLLPVSHP